MSLKTFCLMIVGEYIVSWSAFRVPKILTFKKRPSIQPFLWKWNFFARVKNHSYIKGWALNVVLKRGQGELENGVWVSQGKRSGPLEGRREKGMSAKIRLSSCVGAWRLYRSRSDLDKNLPLHNSFLFILLYTNQILYPITTIFRGFK